MPETNSVCSSFRYVKFAVFHRRDRRLHKVFAAALECEDKVLCFREKFEFGNFRNRYSFCSLSSKPLDIIKAHPR